MKKIYQISLKLWQKYILWGLSILFVSWFLFTQTSYEIIQKTKPAIKIATTSAVIQVTPEIKQVEKNDTQTDVDLSKYMVELSKYNIERVDGWFSTMLSIASILVAIISLGFLFIGFSFLEKIHQINSMYKDAEDTSLKAHEALQNAEPKIGSVPTGDKTGETPFSESPSDSASTSPSASPSPSISASPSPSPEDNSDTEKEKANLLRENEALRQQNIEFAKTAIYEKVYRLIYGSQLLILKLLRGNKPTYSASNKQIEEIYKNSKWFPNYAYDDYIHFLVNAQVMGRNEKDNEYYLTVLGKEFLDYLLDNGYPDKAE